MSNQFYELARKLKKKLVPYYNNFKGWSTNRKIIVFESDDWGSIRMPSRNVYEKCLSAGYRVDQNPYERFDSLASEDDLELLFDTLTKYSDINNRNPVFTANCLTANPDFSKIENDSFENYYNESIEETFNRYPKHSNCINIWKEGLSNRLFFPQSHGREHLNVSLFMNSLKRKDPDLLFAFKHRMSGSLTKYKKNSRNQYVIALDYDGEADKKEKENIVAEGLNEFRNLFGYSSKSYMAPNYFWCPEYNSTMSELGVKYYQGNKKMKDPGGKGESMAYLHDLGERNEYGQIHLVRNSVFEPSLFRMNIDNPIENCLREISISFMLNKPAIICTHRVNYVGYINEENRDKSLKLLNSLLSKILQIWPNVEFMTSVELGDLINSKP